MALQIRWKKDGKLASRYWYADFLVAGKRHVVPLGVKIRGTIPESLKSPGDAKFERSRGAAKAKHDKAVEKARETGSTVKILEHIVDIRTEGQSRSLLIERLPNAWAALPRRRKLSTAYLAYGSGTLQKFVEYMTKHHAGTKKLSDVTVKHVKEFMAEQDKGLTSRTWNEKRMILKAAFCHIEPTGDVCRQLTRTLPERAEDAAVHRQPFTKEDINAILEAAKDDNLIRPLIVTAVATAMRRGDCARLKWSGVDMAAGFICVKSTKTNETVEIPIMPILFGELKLAAKRKHGPDDYVFPEAAALYEQNADGLNNRLRQILAKAGFVDQKVIDKVKEDGPGLPVLPAAELRERGIKGIESMQITPHKRERMRAIFAAYVDGANLPEIKERLGFGTGTSSEHLNKLEKHIGAAIIRRRGPVLPETIRGTLHSRHAEGERLKRGSLRGWHAFRTTFITLALSAGMPMELVQRITGHTTVAVVMKHYFRPNRDHFRNALQIAMPQLLTAGNAAGQ